MIGTDVRSRQSRRTRHPRLFNYLVAIALIISAVLLGFVLLQRDAVAPGPGSVSDDDVLATIAILDVGQALSAAIVTADGASLIYDFGLTAEHTETMIVPFLEDHGVSRIDYAILSHPHQDHVGGLPALIEMMPINLYIDPVLETTNQTYLRSLELIDEHEVTVDSARQGNTYSLGDHVELEILWPTDDLLLAADGSHLLNDNSTVVQVTVGEIEVLLTGDIETDAEHALVEQFGDELAIDILQVAHHGSDTSSQEAFLEASSPSVGIIPVGADNQYGHPHREVVQRLRRHEVAIYRTDVDGSVIVRTDGRAFEVTTTGSGQ